MTTPEEINSADQALLHAALLQEDRAKKWDAHCVLAASDHEKLLATNPFEAAEMRLTNAPAIERGQALRAAAMTEAPPTPAAPPPPIPEGAPSRDDFEKFNPWERATARIRFPGVYGGR